MDVAQAAVMHRTERLEDRAVQDVRADRGLRVEAEDQDQHRRHQAAAAHAGHPDENPDRGARECELPGQERVPGMGHETNGRPRSAHKSLYIRQPVQKPVTAASSASAATSSPSTAPNVGKPAAYATDAAESTTSPTMLAARGGRESSSSPSPKRGCNSSKYARHGRQYRRPNVSPTASCSASSASSHHQPVATATSERTPTTDWFVRGARESITSRSL